MAFLANLYPLRQLLYGYPILLYGVMLSIACACLLKWEETGVPGGNPRKHGENMQTPHRKARAGPETNPGPSCCEATALTTAPPCRPASCLVVVVVILMAFLANLYPLRQLLYGYPILLYGVMLSIACACLLKWEETGVPGGNPRKHGENMQTPHRKARAGPETNPGPSASCLLCDCGLSSIC